MKGRRAIHDVNAPDYPYKSQRARVERLKAAGMCIECGMLRATRGQRCALCYVKHAEAVARTRQLAIDCGICLQCRKRAVKRPGERMCATCARAEQARQRAKELTRPCPKCGGSRAKGYARSGFCKACHAAMPPVAERSGIRAARLVAEGKCQTCGRPRGAKGNARYCRPCADVHAAHALAWYHRNKGRKAK
mgnify:CR=1 FL=1